MTLCVAVSAVAIKKKELKSNHTCKYRISQTLGFYDLSGKSFLLYDSIIAGQCNKKFAEIYGTQSSNQYLYIDGLVLAHCTVAMEQLRFSSRKRAL